MKLAATETSAEILRELHPLRMQRYLSSDLNPWLMPLKFWAEAIRENGWRRPTGADNPFRRLEAAFSEAVAEAIDVWREWRDHSYERLFQWVYENPWLKQLYALEDLEDRESAARREALLRQDARQWRQAMDHGGLPEAVTRMLLAVMLADRDLPRSAYERAGRLFQTEERLKHIHPRQLKAIVRDQARLLQTDTDQAIESLPRLLPRNEDRRQALRLLAAGIDFSGQALNAREQAMLERIQGVLAIGDGK
jgi:hypothetical protein